MNLLFSESGIQRMDKIVQSGLLCAFDFDGTLAPIVTHYEKVQVPYEIEQQLITLARYAPVAIITGRAVQDTRKYMGFSPDFIIGNHGIEGLPDWQQDAQAYAMNCSSWMNTLGTAFQADTMLNSHARIENKLYSLSLHYRETDDCRDIRQRLTNLLAHLTPPPRVVAGKNIFNLLPPNAIDKGVALSKLMAVYHFKSAIYVGDDITDEDVFRLRRADILTVKIGNTEHSAAEFFLREHQDIRHLLDELIMRLRQLRTAHLTSVSRFAN